MRILNTSVSITKLSLTLIILLLALVPLTLFLLLPIGVNHYLLPRYILPLIAQQERPGKLTINQLQLESFTPSSATLLLQAEYDGTRIFLPHLELRYSLSRLRQGLCDQVLMAGGTVDLGRNLLFGLHPESNKEDLARENGFSLPANILLPFATEKLTMSKLLVRFPVTDQGERTEKAAGIDLLLDAEIELGTKSVTSAAKSNNGSLPQRLHSVTVSLATDIASNSTLRLSASEQSGEYKLSGSFELNNLSDVTPFLSNFIMRGASDEAPRTEQQPAPPKLSGKLRIIGEGRFNSRLMPLSFKLDSSLDNFSGSYADFNLTATEPNNPINVHCEGNAENIIFSLNRLRLTAPEQMDFTLTANYLPPDHRLFIQGNIAWDRFSAPVNALFSAETVPGSPKSAEIAIYSSAGDLRREQELLRIGKLHLATQLAETQDGEIHGTMKGTLDSIVSDKNQLSLGKISLQQPFALNASPELKNNAKSERAPSGTLTVQMIRYRNETVGSLNSTHVFHKGHITSTILLHSPVLGNTPPQGKGKQKEPAQISCQTSFTIPGETANDGFAGKCSLSTSRISQKSVPAAWLKLPDELSFAGDVSGETQFHVPFPLNHSREITARLALHLINGEVQHNATSVSQLSTDILLPNLPSLSSAPGQKMTIGSLTSGQFQLSNGRIRFRIDQSAEGTPGVYLEGARFKWCGGTVETGGIQWQPGTKDLELTLYCDRIRFTELLDQFGIEGTEGDGSLNGRLPLFADSRGLRFDDGFLFSTPGNSGIVRFSNTDQLSRNIPGLEQTGQLDYTMQALQNFAYNWTRLTFNSLDEELLVAMQLDGKPAEPLPFGYKNGTIVPQTTGSGLQHPIRLDVNFRLPLQQLLRYGKNLQSILENR